ILVDEYDKPVLDHINNPPIATAMRDCLKGFYSVIKGADAKIRFAFITGVSKFSKVSLFSGLNNLRDITLTPEFSALCGYTDHDLDTVFAPELAGLDRVETKNWYNGYNWLGESVYNPYDILLLLRERKFRPWWFESGTPSFLIKLLTERQTWLPTLGNLQADAELLSTFDVETIPTAALMFQAGYLTIAKEELMGGNYYYTLRFPNREVEQSLYGSLLRVWADDDVTQVKNKHALYSLLTANDLAALKNLFQAFFSSIPHQWLDNNPIAKYEGYYASVFYAYFVAAGLTVQVEDATNLGRIDMSVRLANQIYLFEFKVVESQANGKALQQIQDKRYADKYRALGLPIHLIGVEFAKDVRNIVAFDIALAN
ncbi:MAG: AAA family ATPase, partial [Burkholderiales bacterium]|nr:AAA family ATPase [Burkholderiales bacterium]